MRINSKGQVTIPKAIREKSGLLPGCSIEIEYRDGQVIVKRVVERHTDPGWAVAALERARGTATEPMFREWTTEQIMEFMRGPSD